MLSQSLNPSAPASRANSPLHGESPTPLDVNSEAGSSSNPAASGSSKPRRSNPLTDLIDSEKDYVDLLAGIIRKVASAWSRANFPPSELDAMFRAVEAIFRTNRGFLAKLKDIGPNPTSPKALGDLLMRWIEDLEGPYARYCNSFTTGFDSWERVQSNMALQPLLDEVTGTHPPSPAPADGAAPSWTLDSLFILPRLRLKYYKKLYARLLKSTQPGRSDHRLLVSANEKLEGLLAVVNDRLDCRVGESYPPELGALGLTIERNQDAVLPLPPPPPAKESNGPYSPLLPPPEQIRAAMERTSLTGSLDSEPRMNPSDASVSSGSDRQSRDNTDNERLSRDTGVTSVSAGRSPSALSNGVESSLKRTSEPSPPRKHYRTVSDIERVMDTSRVLDIFTMRPKPCKLQIARPLNALPFVRSVRFEADVEISISPKATGVEVVYERGHVVMLTDLFLVGEWMDGVMDQEEGDDMLSLCFPPLAARHLTIVDEPVSLGEGMDRTFQIQVMRRESLVIRTESAASKVRLVREFNEAIENATNLMAPGRQLTDGPPLNAPFPHSGASSRSISPNPNALPPIPSPDAPFNGTHARRDSNQSHHSRRGSSSASNHTMLSPRNSEHGTLSSFGGRPGYGGETSVPESGNPPRGHPLAARGPSTMPGQQQPGQIQQTHNGPGFPPPGPRGPPGGPPQRYGSGPPPGSASPWSPTGSVGGPFSPARSGPSPGLTFGVQPGIPPQGMSPVGQQGPSLLRKSPSGRSLGSAQSHQVDEGPLPPIPNMPPSHILQQQPPPGPGGFNGHPPNIAVNNMRPGLGFPPPQQQNGGYPSSPSFYGRPGMGMPPPGPDDEDLDSPPPSPVEEKVGPSVISAQMKCKVFLKQQHGQWKALGAAKLKLYEQQPKNVKQLVVEAETKHKELLISTIVLTDGVERVGKTGVAVELSDKGVRTDIVYMIQLRNETSASGLFNSLLAGSDRSTAVRK
ncbi:hypothetical protein FRB96_004685 [Tulasnella sp. 330]|nr:hypothetical protein FRB96_004685 [Tulasnella sp. 330]KAG8878805.1 hypothetical protein FRB97_002222 [Tulasnella sp. 331]